MREGLLGEFRTEGELEHAIHALRARGYRRLDAFTPYLSRAVERALGLDRSRLPWAIFVAGLAGAAVAYFLQWYLNAADYPLVVGQRPPHSAPAFLPITFETTVLFAAFAGIFGLLAVVKLPELWHPIFEASGFDRATMDRFWLGVDAMDPNFSRERATRDLEDAGAIAVTWAGRPGE